MGSSSDIFEFSPILIAWLDETSHIQAANQSMVRFAASAAFDLLGKDIATLPFRPASERAREDGSQLYEHEPTGQRFVLSFHHWDGVRGVFLEPETPLKFGEMSTQFAAMPESFNALHYNVRAPLNAVVGATELLNDGDEVSAELLSILRSSVTKLSNRLVEFFDFASFESAETELDVVEFEFASLLGELVESHPVHAIGAAHMLTHIGENCGEKFLGDKRRIFHTLGNLTTTVANLMPGCAINVSVSQISLVKGQATILFQVTADDCDTGPAQANSWQAADHNPIPVTEFPFCESLIRAMGGELKSETSSNKVVFSFKIALESVFSPKLATGVTANPCAKNNCRVLVAEDDEFSRCIFERYLKGLGCTVVTAIHGIQAVNTASKQNFDLILMDCQMPALNGYEATLRIREGNGPNKDVPIVAITALALDANKETCRQVGMTEILTKPVNRGHLMAMLEQLGFARLGAPASVAG